MCLCTTHRSTYNDDPNCLILWGPPLVSCFPKFCLFPSSLGRTKNFLAVTFFQGGGYLSFFCWVFYRFIIFINLMKEVFFFKNMEKWIQRFIFFVLPMNFSKSWKSWSWNPREGWILLILDVTFVAFSAYLRSSDEMITVVLRSLWCFSHVSCLIWHNHWRVQISCLPHGFF